MRRGPLLLWSGVSLATSLTLSLIAMRAINAQQAATDAFEMLEAIETRTHRLNMLRASSELDVAAPPGWLAASLTEALQHAGLPSVSLANLSPEASVGIGDGAAVAIRRRATFILTGVTLPQLGAFLGVWREAHPNWVIARLDLTPENGNHPNQGGDLPLRVVIAIEGIFMDPQRTVQ